MPTKDLINMDLFGECLNCKGIRKVIEGRVLTETVSTLQGAYYQVLPIVSLSRLRK
jgi:hypothetical protein